MRTTASTHTGGALFEAGALAAGYKPIWGVEIRPDIADVAERNMPGLAVIRSDVALVDWASLERPYHFHTSPSCKNASVANVEAGEVEEDLSSARAICAALRVMEPPTFSLENVWGYRNFESFKMIVRALREIGYCVDWWHLNAADYGVAQTRKRLVLIAAKDFQPRKPPPAHSKTPDMFGVYKPWVGWYEAIADLVDELPESEFAPWQLERLPAELKTMLLAQGGYDGQVTNRSIEEPSFTVTSNSNQGGVRALLLNRNKSERDDHYKPDNEPGYTVCGESGGRQRAFIVDPFNTSREFTVRQEDEPFVTVNATHMRRPITTPKAFIVGSHYAQPNTVKDRQPQVRLAAKPYFTVTASGGTHNDARAFVGRVVKLTPRALARLQSVPDWYQLPDANGLACEIIGNGVPCKLAQAIMESLKR